MIDTKNAIDSARFNGLRAREKFVTDRVSGKKFNDVLHDSLKTEKKRVKDEKLMDVCVEMESIFVSKMLREMRNTIHKSQLLHGGFAEEIFEDMLYDKYALSISKNSSLGLAGMLYNELSGKK